MQAITTIFRNEKEGFLPWRLWRPHQSSHMVVEEKLANKLLLLFITQALGIFRIVISTTIYYLPGYLYVYISMINSIPILGVRRYGIQQPKRKQINHYQRRISLINFL